ncbi:virulence factor Mce-like protein [Halopolyspora algeriensis]|uniref:Virulence factor Mce-like protein n=1 Tax=Halopolyspora algeriensis TaxID=1500506 RepID=A0A368W3Z5_9ACTN|nr:MCE family protein [Halopolyspora algeriensis]RCW46790.1 virulence factor Mce-like protein [Halopolyspora algeriensis]TQM39208.1 virulence factor Mce-like protein [Halopolyspora algeriensis]
MRSIKTAWAVRPSRLGKPPFTRTLALACTFTLLVTAAAWWLFFGANERRLTAYFDTAVGVYEGSEVRVLGVPVGRVEKVQPQPKKVRVAMTVRRDVKIPADAGAVAVSPSVVSGRYIQLAPVYEGGPTMDDGAVIGNERTVTPVEVDEIFSNLNKLNVALGPKGANSDGALSKLLETSAANLKGNGKLLSEMLKNFGQASSTLSGSSEDLFATVDKLQKFTSMLASKDEQVRRFNTQMREIQELFASERQDLGAALSELALALGKVESFVRNNREKLHSNVEQLNSVAQVLVEQQAALRKTLTYAPLALGNLQNTYNAASGTLDTRANINELNQPPIVLVCKLVQQTAPETGTALDKLPQGLTDLCKQLQGVIDGTVPLPTPAETISALQQGKLPELPLPVQRSSDAVFGTQQQSTEGGGR